jgi:hypothetical protein
MLGCSESDSMLSEYQNIQHSIPQNNCFSLWKYTQNKTAKVEVRVNEL